MTNVRISEQLEYAAFLLEYREGASFAVRRLHEMAQAIVRFDFPLSLFSEGADFKILRSLFFPRAHGEVLSFLRDLIHEEETSSENEPEKAEDETASFTSRSPFILHLEKEITPETVELIKLPEMGAQRAAILRDALGIRNIDDLRRNCRQHLVQKIDGFDPYLEKRWLQGRWHSGVKTGFSSLSWPMAELIVPFLMEQMNPLLAISDPEETITPWELFQREKRRGEDFDRYAAPVVYPARNPRYVPPATGYHAGQNVRYRKPLVDRIRDFFTRREPNYVDPRFFDPFGMEKASSPEDRETLTPKKIELSANSFLVSALEPVGDYRRLEETVESLDFLVSTKHPQTVFDQISALPFIRGVSSRNDMELSVAIDKDQLIYGNHRKFPGAVLHFYACYPGSFVTESVYRSSSKGHWDELKRRAVQKGFVLDSTGLFRIHNKSSIRLESEIELYQSLDIPFLPPEIRNGLFEFDLKGNMPELLIRKEDIRGDLHLHSVFTDGTGTIEEMAEKGIELGLDYMAMTDHSKRVAIAGGMNEIKLKQYWEKIDQINQELEFKLIPFTILKGVEVDMLADGELDFSDEILSQADWVMASLHFEQGQPRDMIHRRIETALANPYVNAVSHPTGKTFQSDFRIDMDIDFLFENAKKFGKCLELNCQPRRFDLDWRLCRKAKEHGIKIVISTDSHSPDEMEFLRYGVQLARKAGLTKDDVLNTLPVSAILSLRHRLPMAEPTFKKTDSHKKEALR